MQLIQSDKKWVEMSFQDGLIDEIRKCEIN